MLAISATLIGTVLFTDRQVKIYKATASIIIEATSPTVLNGTTEVIELGSGGFWANSEYMKTQIEVLKSQKLAKRVVDRLGLALDPRFLGLDRISPPLTDEEMRSHMGKMDAAAMLMNGITITLKRDSRMVEVGVEHSDPVLAMELANAVAEEYSQQNLELKRKILGDANVELQNVVRDLKVKKDEAERRVLSFERTHGVGNLESRKEEINTRLKHLQEKYVGNNIDSIVLGASRIREELEQRIALVEQMLTIRDPEKVNHPKVVSSSDVSQLRLQLVAQRLRLEEVAALKGEKHYDYIAVKEQISLLKVALRNSVNRILEAELFELREQLKEETNKLNSAIDQQRGIVEELRDAREEQSALLRIELEYRPLVSELEEAMKVYEGVRQRWSETTLSAQVETNNVRIQDLAKTPKRPIKPNLKFNLFAGFILGVMLGVGAAFFAESLDNTIRDRADVDEIPGLYFLGILPSVRKTIHAVGTSEYSRERDLYPYYHPKSSASEHLRSIQTNVLFNDPGKRPRNILVVSPNPREGKTTMALHLSIIMATSGIKTLIVDTDMRRPRIHKTFDLVPSGGGVAAYLVQGGDVGDFINQTEVPNLDLFGSGVRPPNPVELLQSTSFDAMVKELNTRYDIVVFDSPPILAVADCRIIARHCDSVVCIGKARQTTRDTLREGRRFLDTVFPEPVGCVVNDVDMSSGSYHYYYYYGTKYGYYAAIDDQEEDGRSTGKKRFKIRLGKLWPRRSA